MKIAINLLPPEIVTQKLKRTKFYKIQNIGIIVILLMVFLASLTIALRVLQSRSVVIVRANLDQLEQQVTGLQSTQASLLLLQDRLNVIGQYWGVSSKQSAMYKLLDKLIPPAVSINAITIDKGGEATFLALVPDSTNLDTLITNLTTKEDNEGQISRILLDSLNRGRDGFYRVSFKVKP